MKRTLVFLTLFASTAIVFGQDKPEPNKTEPKKTAPTQAATNRNPVSDTVREMLPHQQKNIIAAVEEMPADKFGYSPTPAQMAFGHMVAHMTMSNIELCSKAGSMPPPPLRPAAETDKDRLLANLTRSFLYCEAALNRVDDSKLGDTVELYGGRQATVAFALFALTSDWADHYSAAAMYLRLNGLLPPTAQPQK
ncbi:MAG TPA: DinB family protein [Terriglobales bacterium]|nr:DinB family protein [Terriglobales bacterium]